MNKIEGTLMNLDEWTDQYQRNNKRSGVKNLRCFPCCSLPHHMDKGYCGRPVILSLKKTPYLDQAELFAWAEFKTVDEPPRIAPGSYMSANEVKSLTRSRMDIYKPWYRGDISKSASDVPKDEIQVHFNTSKKGWNYNWAASRNAATIRHVLICYLCTLDEAQQGTFRCLAIFESPSFTIYCRKQNGVSLAALRKMGTSTQGSNDEDDQDDIEEEEDDDESEGKAATQKSKQTNHKKQQQQMQTQIKQQPIPPQIPFQQQQQQQHNQMFPNYQTQHPIVHPMMQMQPLISQRPHHLPPSPEYGVPNVYQTPNILTSSVKVQDSKLSPDQPTQINWIPNMHGTNIPPRQYMPQMINVADDQGWRKMIPAIPNAPFYQPIMQNQPNWNMAHAPNPANIQGPPVLGNMSNYMINSNSGNTTVADNNPQMQPEAGLINNGYQDITGMKRPQMDPSNSNIAPEDDTNRRIIRLCILLDKLDGMLRENGTASKMGVPQFVLEEFLEEIGNVGFEDEGNEDTAPLTDTLALKVAHIQPITYENDPKNDDPNFRGEGVNGPGARKLVEELMGYLLNESLITTSFKSLASSRNSSKNSNQLDIQQRKMDFINIVHKNLETFLSSKGFTFADLDVALQIPKKDAVVASRAIKKFEEQVRMYIEDEDKFEQRKRARLAASSSSGAAHNAIQPQNAPAKTIDLTGEWRLDDATLEALDSLRTARGLPWFVRQLLSFMEKKIIVEHLPDRLLVRLNRKLLSTGYMEYLLDQQQHNLTSTGPFPGSRPVVETYRAWVDGDTFRFIHNYSAGLRSERAIKKNAAGDRLEITVNLQEWVANGNGYNGDGHWKTIVEKTGYAMRGPG